MKAEVDKLDINNKLVNVPTGLNTLKPKVDDLDVDKLKSVPVDLQKVSDAVSKGVVKKLENKIPDAASLTCINQCNTDRKSGKKIGDANKKIPDVSGLMTNIVLNTKFGEVESKIPDVRDLVQKTL